MLFGYQRTAFRWHHRVARIVVGAGFDGGKGPGQPADWARLELVEPVSVPPLPLRAARVSAGTAVALAGYNQDRAQLLMADMACQVLRVATLPGGAMIVTHDCAATRGTSGAPLLAKEDRGWAVIAINIAAGRAENLALAAPFGE